MIVVTGASGFIGRNLVNLLRNKGEKPITVDFHNFVGDIDYDPFIFLKSLLSSLIDATCKSFNPLLDP